VKSLPPLRHCQSVSCEGDHPFASYTLSTNGPGVSYRPPVPLCAVCAHPHHGDPDLRRITWMWPLSDRAWALTWRPGSDEGLVLGPDSTFEFTVASGQWGPITFKATGDSVSPWIREDVAAVVTDDERRGR
jgi:hypothetical protein